MKRQSIYAMAMIVLLSIFATGCRGKGNLDGNGEEIQVLVIYTPEALSAGANGRSDQFETLIHERLNFTNGAFMQSGVTHQLVLAGTMETVTEATIASEMEVNTLKQKHVRNWMSAQLEDHSSHLHNQRHQSQADSVSYTHLTLPTTSRV